MAGDPKTAEPARNQVGLRIGGVIPGSADEGPGVPVGGKPAEQTQTADHLGRDAKDFAIEFGRYLADAAERYMDTVNRAVDPEAGCDPAEWTERASALERTIHEFRKRAQRAALADLHAEEKRLNLS